MKKKARTEAEITQEFVNLCARIGDLEFSKRLAEMELQQLFPRAFALRQELKKVTSKCLISPRPSRSI